MPDIPLDQLTMRDGVLMQTQPSLPDTEFMATAPVRVAAKSTLVELPHGDVSYMFALSHRPDAVWADLFAAGLDGLAAEIQGSQLEFSCRPGHLEQTYARARDLIVGTNRRYAELRAELIERVATLDAERLDARSRQDERSQLIREQFERLDL